MKSKTVETLELDAFKPLIAWNLELKGLDVVVLPSGRPITPVSFENDVNRPKVS